MIILLDQKEYAVGLSWFAISTTDEVEQFQRELDLQYGVIKMSKIEGEQSTVALCAPEYNGQVSLAGMLSFAYQNLIYVTATEYKDDNGQPLFYLCAIKNHAVTVDGDVIGTRETIVGLYSQNFTDLTADIDSSEVTCYGTGVDEEMFPGISLVESHQVLDQATRFASQATIKPLGKKELSKLSMVAVLVIVSGICIGIYEYFFNQPPPPPPPVAVAPVPVAPPPPKEDPYQVFLQQFASTLQSQPRPTIILSAVAALKTLPLAYEGWTVSSANFTGASNTFSIALTRQPPATANDLQQLVHAGRLTSVDVDIAGEGATATLPVDLSNVQQISIESIKALTREDSPQYFALLSLMQSHSAVEFKPGESQRNDYFAQTKMTFTGIGLWSMTSLSEMLSTFQTIGINSIGVKLDNGDYNWIIEGVIYG